MIIVALHLIRCFWKARLPVSLSFDGDDHSYARKWWLWVKKILPVTLVRSLPFLFWQAYCLLGGQVNNIMNNAGFRSSKLVASKSCQVLNVKGFVFWDFYSCLIGVGCHWMLETIRFKFSNCKSALCCLLGICYILRRTQT